MLSFIIPAFDEELELPGSLDAVRAAAHGIGEPFEIIVVDDSSTDATPIIAREFGARVIPVRCRQIAAVRNAGARAALGEILFFVDADTRIRQQHISGALQALAGGCSGGSARLQMDGKVPIGARLFFALFAMVYFGAGLGAGAFLFTRRENYEAIGGFDEQYFAGEEVYFSMALKKLGPFKILREPAITSGRKVRMHKTRHVVTQFLFMMLRGPCALRSREKLPLWYDGKRESSST